MLSRRHFISNGTKLAVGLGIMEAIPMDVLAGYRTPVLGHEKIRIGLIGCKGMGWMNLTTFLKIPQVDCVALCDIDQNVLEERRKELEKIQIAPKIYTDHKALLADPAVDAVIIATPDHWHCLIFADACKAGKHIYVEKPIANSIYEAKAMVAAAKKTGKIIQVNQWQRSQDHFKNAIEFVRSGKLGNISMCKTWMHRAGSVALPVVADSSIPQGVDYKRWLGPAPLRPFNKNRFHYEFRWFWDYAGGLMTDWGVHLIDMVLLGMNVSMPKSVSASGGKYVFPTDARETPDVEFAVYNFEHFTMTWEHTLGSGNGIYGLNHGIAFLGEKGTLVLNRDGWEVIPEKDKNQPKMEAVPLQKRSDSGITKHTQNFIEAIQKNDPSILNCPIEAGATVAINAHMANIALRNGRTIHWKNEQFLEPSANALMKPTYHNGWILPSINS